MHALRRKNVFATSIIIINVEIINTGQFNKVFTQYLSSESKISTYFLQFHFIVVLLLFFGYLYHKCNLCLCDKRAGTVYFSPLPTLSFKNIWWHLTFRSLSTTRSKQKSRVSTALKKLCINTVYNNVILHYKQVDIRLLSNFNFKTL